MVWWFFSIPPPWTSNKLPAVASECCLYHLPIILLAPKHKIERKGDCIYSKGEKEWSKGTEGESYRFDWTPFLFSGSTGEISLKGCCSLSIGPREWILWSQWWRERERERGLEGFMWTEQHRGKIVFSCVTGEYEWEKEQWGTTGERPSPEPVDILWFVLRWSRVATSCGCRFCKGVREGNVTEDIEAEWSDNLIQNLKRVSQQKKRSHRKNHCDLIHNAGNCFWSLPMQKADQHENFHLLVNFFYTEMLL